MTSVSTTLLPMQTVGRKIYVQRDYSQGLGVRFATTFPTDLNGRIDAETFDFLIQRMNHIFAKAEAVSFYSVMDSILGCLTAYLSYACCESYYDRCLKKISRLIEDQNETNWKPKGLLLTDPRDRGLRVFEITIFESAFSLNGSGKDAAVGIKETALE